MVADAKVAGAAAKPGYAGAKVGAAVAENDLADAELGSADAEFRLAVAERILADAKPKIAGAKFGFADAKPGFADAKLQKAGSAGASRRDGSRRFGEELSDAGGVGAPDRIRGIMRQRGLRAIRPKTYVPKTSDGRAGQPSANLLSGQPRALVRCDPSGRREQLFPQ